jgi:hypothetical protein
LAAQCRALTRDTGSEHSNIGERRSNGSGVRRLPFAAGLVDLLVFTASWHDSTAYLVTLREALRVLRPEGVLEVPDSPLYHHAVGGQAMVRGREAAFSRRFVFPSNALASGHYLTSARLRDLAGTLGIPWKVTAPRHGIRVALRRSKTLLVKRREAARFPLIVARKGEGEP